VAVLVVCGLLYMAIPIGIVGNAFSKVWEDRDRLLLVQRTRDRMIQGGYTAKDIPDLFALFDSSRLGEVALHDFRAMIFEMRIGIDDERTVQLFNTIDLDGNGRIDAKEFVRALFPEEYAWICSDVEALNGTPGGSQASLSPSPLSTERESVELEIQRLQSLSSSRGSVPAAEKQSMPSQLTADTLQSIEEDSSTDVRV